MRTFGPIRRGIAALLLVVYLPACFSYVSPKPLTPQEYLDANHPKHVRVTLTDKTRRVLRDPWAGPDSIGGVLMIRGPSGSYTAGAAWAVPLSSVGRVEFREHDIGATIGVVFVSVLLIGGVIAGAIALSNWDL